jgi:hypothetical protein
VWLWHAFHVCRFCFGFPSQVYHWYLFVVVVVVVLLLLLIVVACGSGGDDDDDDVDYCVAC